MMCENDHLASIGLLKVSYIGNHNDCITYRSPGDMEFVRTIAPFMKTESKCLLPNWDKDSIRNKYRFEGKIIALFGGNRKHLSTLPHYCKHQTPEIGHTHCFFV